MDENQIVEWIRLDQITIDDDLQARSDGLNSATVQEYATLFQDQGEDGNGLPQCPPIQVARVGDKLLLTDGRHRYEAAAKAGIPSLPAAVVVATPEEAILLAARANRFHGLPRSRDDKHRAAMMLLSHPEWGRRSARWIAKEVGVSHTFVAKLKHEIDSVGVNTLPGGKVSTSENETTLGVDGKRYPRKRPPKRKKTRNDSEFDCKAEELPPEVRDTIPLYNRLVQVIGQAENLAESIADSLGAVWLDTQRLRSNLRGAKRETKYGCPYALCPHCNGSGGEEDNLPCSGCRGHGWVPRSTLDDAPDDEQNAEPLPAF